MSNRDRTSRSGNTRSDRVKRLAATVRRNLADLVEQLRADRPGGHLAGGGAPAPSIRLPLPEPSENGDRSTAFEARLLAELERLVDDEILQQAAFRPGRVFCFRCGDSDCSHAAPPEPRSVFVGWTATGQPRWSEFAQLCLDRRHPQVDRLYGESPAIIYLMQDPDELTLDLLPALLRESATRLAAQVSLGFFSAGPAGPRGGLRAITAQAVASASPRGPLRLTLNLIGAEPGLASARGGKDVVSPWAAPARRAQSKLDTLARRTLAARRRSRGRRADAADPDELLRRGATAILAELGRRTARQARGRFRRTDHAEQRHNSGKRPTRTALEDLRRSEPSSLLVDERSEAIVVPGHRGRTHFFSADGRLVSSVRYGQTEVAKKQKLGLWRPASAEEAAALIEAVRLANGEDP